MQLTVLFDASCGLCRRAARWLRAQRAYVRLELIPAAGIEARRRFPGLDRASTLERLTVVADDGRVWRGAKAWVMCLWALEGYRGWAATLGHPDRLPWARRFVDRVSRNRHRISAWLDRGPQRDQDQEG